MNPMPLPETGNLNSTTNPAESSAAFYWAPDLGFATNVRVVGVLYRRQTPEESVKAVSGFPTPR